MIGRPARNLIRAHGCHIAATVIGLLSSTADRAFAAGAGMPWEGPLNQLVASLTGPVAKGIGVVAIVISALGMAIAESGHFMKRALTVVFALSVVFSATNLVAMFFGFSGGLAL